MFQIDSKAAYLCVLANQESNKIVFFSSIPQPHPSSLQALKIVEEIIAKESIATGRCGGKAHFAQGSLQLPNEENNCEMYQELIERIRNSVTAIK